MDKAWMSPFFDLPPAAADPEMQEHFHDCLPTSLVRVRAFDAAYCSVMIHQALEDPAVCHTVIAMAATYSAIHGHGLRAPDTKLLSLYDRAFRALRQQSGQASRAQHLDTLIMATLNLLMCHGIAFGDKSIMAVYSAALKNLVDACCGIAHLSAQSAALCLWADLYVTLYTGQKPIFL